MSVATKVLEKIEKLESRLADPEYPEDLIKVQEWRDSVNKIILKEDLLKHEIIQEIINHAKEEIERISAKLQTSFSSELPDDERDKLLYQKSMWKWFGGMFSNLEEEVIEIEKKVDYEESEEK